MIEEIMSEEIMTDILASSSSLMTMKEEEKAKISFSSGIVFEEEKEISSFKMKVFSSTVSLPPPLPPPPPPLPPPLWQ